MHITIILPAFMKWEPGLVFLLLKALFDLIGHVATTPYYWQKENKDKP